ncbi:phage tail family protein [Lederbergia lenta]|uniref:phage tail family protein n=1 Tax=Lederbergia lenta TaxID=1467 RepID=UPI00203AFDDC|nr:phage tail family protein [Lederbergia lenta]MCM3110688.1 phage tail family protein [Lederbergia lenta]
MIIVERKSGEKYKLDKSLGLRVIDFVVESPAPRTKTSEIDGMDGHRDLGTTYAGRVLHVKLKMTAPEIYEFALIRNELFRIFDSREEFYLISEEEPRKRWRVKYNSPFSLPRKNLLNAEIDITFQSPSAYSESIGSLLDPYTFEVELWQFGMNIPMVDFSYIHNTRQFSIWNLGDKLINPRHDMLQIFYKGASNNLAITNTTTGDTWQYNGSSQAGDTITLDGVFSRKNGVSIFGNTNRKLISLAPGENKFILAGTSGVFEIAFDFRFLYL